MAIRFVNTPEDRPRKPAKVPEPQASESKGPSSDAAVPPEEAEPDTADRGAPRRRTPKPTSDARADGEARFATPIEASAPVNPDPSGELPFTDLPRAEKAARKKRTAKPKEPAAPEEPGLA